MEPQNYTTGEYAVGTEYFTVIDESREESLGEASGFRKVSVRMYYPVSKEAVAGQARSRVFSEQLVKQLKKCYHIPKISDEMLYADFYEKTPHINEKFPLILFSHGFNAYIEANNYLCCDLASRGYIVASVGHSYEAVEIDFEDGTYAVYDKTVNKRMYTKSVWKVIKEQNKILRGKKTADEAYKLLCDFQDTNCPYIKNRIVEWAEDMIVALNHLKTRYNAWIDFEAGIGASGHSLGGACAYYLCQYQKEITCGINIDGALFGDYTGMTMERPFLQICCKENYNMMTKPLLDTTAAVYYAIFHQMKHIGFTDAKFYIQIKQLVGKLDGQVMYDNLSRLHFDFFDKYLKKKSIEIKESEIVGE